MRERFETSDCPTYDIAGYIDGELGPDREGELEQHFAACESCLFELNEQKRFLSELESGLLAGEEIDLPEDFTKHVIANAESSVSGLRRPGERYNAIFISSGLALFVLFASGAEAGKIFAGLAGILEQISIVAGFFGHLVYSLFLGFVIVVRSVAAQASIDFLPAIALASIGILSLTAVSKKILQFRRA